MIHKGREPIKVTLNYKIACRSFLFHAFENVSSIPVGLLVLLRDDGIERFLDLLETLQGLHVRVDPAHVIFSLLSRPRKGCHELLVAL